MRVLFVLAMLAVVATADPKPAPKPAPKLAITAVEPNIGEAEGGTYVRITGTRFIVDGARNAKVYFGNH